MLSKALYSRTADVDGFIDWAFFDLMKSAAEIYDNQHELTSECIHQIEIAVDVLNGIINRNKEAVLNKTRPQSTLYNFSTSI